jgi:hypothetical protein
VRWEEARELAGPLRLEAAARLPPPPPALVLARELGGSSVETGQDGAQIMSVVRFSLLCYLTHTFNSLSTHKQLHDVFLSVCKHGGHSHTLVTVCRLRHFVNKAYSTQCVYRNMQNKIIMSPFLLASRTWSSCSWRTAISLGEGQSGWYGRAGRAGG